MTLKMIIEDMQQHMDHIIEHGTLNTEIDEIKKTDDSIRMKRNKDIIINVLEETLKKMKAEPELSPET